MCIVENVGAALVAAHENCRKQLLKFKNMHYPWATTRAAPTFSTILQIKAKISDFDYNPTTNFIFLDLLSL